MCGGFNRLSTRVPVGQWGSACGPLALPRRVAPAAAAAASDAGWHCSALVASCPPRQSPPRPSRRTHAARPRAPNSDRHLSCTVVWLGWSSSILCPSAPRHDISLQECFLHVKPCYCTFCKCSFACMKCQVRYLLYNRPDTGQQTRAGDFFLVSTRSWPTTSTQRLRATLRSSLDPTWRIRAPTSG